MKRILLLLCVLFSLQLSAQTQSSLPAGSVPFGSVFIATDGAVWAGATGKTFKKIGLKEDVTRLNDSITALRTSINGKVDKITGKGLSTEDYSTAEKSKLSGIATYAEVNVNADWDAVSGDAQILNKPTVVSTEVDPVFTAQKGANNGVATLNSSGKVPNSQIPSLALVDTYVAASQAAMLALSTAEQGDVAIRTDISKTFILVDANYSTLASWKELLSPIIPGETDPIWGASASAGISPTNISNWNTAYGWGNHAELYYNYATIQAFFAGSSAITGYNKSNWDSGFSWGNHAGLYPTYSGSGASGIWGINITGNAATASNSTLWKGVSMDAVTYSSGTIQTFLGFNSTNNRVEFMLPAAMQTFLGLGSNAYTSTAFYHSGNPQTSIAWTGVSGRPTALSGLSNDLIYGWALATTKPSYAWSEITSKPTTVSAFTNDAGYIANSTSSLTNYYTSTQIQNFFSGASAITGYNRSDWNSAYGWGNHAGLYLPASGGTLTGIFQIDGINANINLNRTNISSSAIIRYYTNSIQKWWTGLGSGGTDDFFIDNNGTTAIRIYSGTQAVTLTGALTAPSATFSSGMTLAGATATSIFTTLSVGGTSYGYSGVSGSSGSVITGSVLGDAVIRTVNKSILFSTNDGSTAAFSLAASTGAATFTGALSAPSATFSGRINGVVGGTAYNTAGLWLQGSGSTDGISIGGVGSSYKNINTYGGSLKLNDVSGNGIELGGALSAPSATFSGSIASTLGNNGRFLYASSATTGYSYLQISNTGGNLILGTEGSTPGNLATGSSAYSSIFTTATSTALQFGINQIVKYTIDASGNNTWTGSGTFSSSVTATGFYESSDIRFKNILSRTVSKDGFDMISYTWKPELKRDSSIHFGYVAQEVEKVYPSQVQTDEKGYKSVNYTEVLVKKIAELENRIKQLEK